MFVYRVFTFVNSKVKVEINDAVIGKSLWLLENIF